MISSSSFSFRPWRVPPLNLCRKGPKGCVFKSRQRRSFDPPSQRIEMLAMFVSCCGTGVMFSTHLPSPQGIGNAFGTSLGQCGTSIFGYTHLTHSKRPLAMQLWFIVELPYRWHKAVDKVRAALPARVTTQSWNMHIFSQLPYPDNYKAFKQRRGRSLKPLETPQRLAALPSGLDAGQVPSLADLEAAVAAAFAGRQAAEV